MPRGRSLLCRIQQQYQGDAGWRIHTGLSSILAWAATSNVAWAQDEGKAYVIPYTVVVLVIALALMLVLRPAGRSSEVKPKSEE